MKHSVITLTLLLATAFGTILAAQQPQAQEQSHRPMDPQKQLDHLAKKLVLTADQQTQILPILNDRQQQVTAIQSDLTLSDKDRRSKVKAIRSDSESKIRNILTDTQRSAYDEMQQQSRDRAKARKQTGVS